MTLVFPSPRLLLMALALVALAVLFVHDSRPVAAEHQNTVVAWSATLTQPTIPDPPYLGCRGTGSIACTSTSVLTDDDFTFDGVDYAITSVGVGNAVASIVFDKAIPAAMQSGGTLWIRDTPLSFADASISGMTAAWGVFGDLTWEAGDEVQMGLYVSRPPVWTATLTAADMGGARYGCDNSRSGDECSSALTDDDFAYNSVDYQITAISLRRGTLNITLDTDIPTDFNALTLSAGSVHLALADNNAAALNQAQWSSTGLSWSQGDTVKLSLASPTQQTGVEVSPETLAVDEGSSGTFTVALSADPGSDTTVTLVRTQYNQSNVGQDDHRWNVNAASLSPGTLDFTAGGSGNWGTAQTVTVTAPEDSDSCSEQLVVLVLVSDGSTPPDYEAVGGGTNTVDGVFVTIADDDGGACGGI